MRASIKSIEMAELGNDKEIRLVWSNGRNNAVVIRPPHDFDALRNALLDLAHVVGSDKALLEATRLVKE